MATCSGSIQTAIEAAAPGDTVQVAGIAAGDDYDTGNSSGGGCSGNNGIHSDNRSPNEKCESGRWLQHQFWPANSITYLDAQGLGRVIYVGPGINATISGFHIINGFVSGSNGNGAGICIDNAAPVIKENHIYSQTATNGAAIYSLDSTARIDGGNHIYLNTATNGGAVYVSSGTAIATKVQNNFVYSNTATNGAAFYNAVGDNNFWHNTIYSNTATGTGAAFDVAADSPNFQNNIAMNNSGGAVDGAFGAGGSTPIVDHNDFFGQVTDFGGTIANGGSGHISANPGFTDLPALDFTIAYTSPVVDVGAIVPLFEDYETDIRPSHQGYDMGADEFGGCYARVSSAPTVIYGSVQTAVDIAASGDTVDVDGTCFGVNSLLLPGSSETITQNLFIDKDLILNGMWDYQTAQMATLDARYQGRVLYINSGHVVTITNIILHRGNGSLGGRTDAGGGIWNDAELTLLDSTILSNTAGIGGGIYNVDRIMMNGSLLQGNTAVDGGGFYNSAGNFIADLSAQNQFFHNLATNNGGGIYQAEGVLSLNGNEFHFNRANNDGGAVYLSGGTDDTLDIINNFIYANTALNHGAGLYNSNTNGRVWHNTFVSNLGSGLYSTSSAGHVIHSNIFDSNSGSGIESTLPSADIDYNNVINNAPNYGGSATAGANDISATPAYEDSSIADFHLQATSAGIDVADPDITAVGDNLKHDFDDDIRPTNGGPDMGADEY